jgi:glycerol-3-phosphate dehydrogenase
LSKRLPEPSQHYDLLVVGGGINGAGIARDAAGRGLRVLLCEQGDLAGATSSASTKLIHGGLRYLEFYHFVLVRKALREREVLLDSAPHIMWPLRFVMPHDAHLRPAWMIRAGLFLYDHLARRRRLPASTSINLRRHAAGAPLQPHFTRGFVYSDGWVDDARLVVLNALSAVELGASVQTRMRCDRLEPCAEGWRAALSARELNVTTSKAVSITATAAVNATGPWAASFLANATPVQGGHELRLVKGSHIIVPRMFAHDHAYIFQAPDRRIVFAIPYEHEFTLIGTTDIEHVGKPEDVKIDSSEIEYLCELANRYFRQSIAPRDVVAHYTGVRPLLEDESADARSVTRDYSLQLTTAPAPLLTVFGGKITTYRALAEEAMQRLATVFPHMRAAWTAGSVLPGGDLPQGDFNMFCESLAGRYAFLPADTRRRLARAYGTRITQVLGGASSLEELGAELAPGLFEREVEYLYVQEWARIAADVLWRRSKLGLVCDAAAVERVEHWLQKRRHI